jgi:hypothetical protein
MVTQLARDPAITAYIAAINSFDVYAIMDTFARQHVGDRSRRQRPHPLTDAQRLRCGQISDRTTLATALGMRLSGISRVVLPEAFSRLTT